MNRSTMFAVTCFVCVLAGCDSKPLQPANPAAPSSPSSGAPSNKPAVETIAAPGHGSGIIELGTEKAGELTVRATRDKGELKAGGDAPIDVWLTNADGTPATVTAVRFWIGTEDAKGSIKAKAEIEDPRQKNHWHTHTEVPNPLPAGAKLWVEVEVAGEKKSLAFAIK